LETEGPSCIIRTVIVDFHTHVFPPDIRDNRQQYMIDPCFGELYVSPKARIATAEEVVAHMEETGIDAAVIHNVGWASQETCEKTNDYILDSAARYPGRLIPFVAIQPLAGKAAVAELERCARGGARGIGEMRSDTQGFDLGDRRLMEPIAEVAIRYRLPFNTHSSEPVGHLYPGKGDIGPGVLYRFIMNFPELRVILSHWGGGLPFYALMPEVATALANTYFDTAATPFLYRPEVFRYVSELCGADKILMGSDYPLMSPRRVIAQVESLRLDSKTVAMILGENARRLLEWSESGVSSP